MAAAGVVEPGAAAAPASLHHHAPAGGGGSVAGRDDSPAGRQRRHSLTVTDRPASVTLGHHGPLAMVRGGGRLRSAGGSATSLVRACLGAALRMSTSAATSPCQQNVAWPHYSPLSHPVELQAHPALGWRRAPDASVLSFPPPASAPRRSLRPSSRRRRRQRAATPSSRARRRRRPWLPYATRTSK